MVNRKSAKLDSSQKVVKLLQSASRPMTLVFVHSNNIHPVQRGTLPSAQSIHENMKFVDYIFGPLLGLVLCLICVDESIYCISCSLFCHKVQIRFDELQKINTITLPELRHKVFSTIGVR